MTEPTRCFERSLQEPDPSKWQHEPLRRSDGSDGLVLPDLRFNMMTIGSRFVEAKTYVGTDAFVWITCKHCRMLVLFPAELVDEPR